jgi:hypothetical protein
MSLSREDVEIIVQEEAAQLEDDLATLLETAADGEDDIIATGVTLAQGAAMAILLARMAARKAGHATAAAELHALDIKLDRPAPKVAGIADTDRADAAGLALSAAWARTVVDVEATDVNPALYSTEVFDAFCGERWRAFSSVAPHARIALEWSASLEGSTKTGGGTCSECRALHGLTVRVEKGFPGAAEAPLHPRCRCLVFAVTAPDGAT